MKTVPDNFTSVTSWIISPSSADLITFLEAAFGAEEIPGSRIAREDGVIIHAVVRIGTAMVMLFDSREGWPASPAFLNLYVEDVQKTYDKAIELGATSVTNITELYFGEKVSRIIDPFGNLWWINERVSEEIKDPSASESVAGIAYIQQSLDEGMKAVKKYHLTIS